MKKLISLLKSLQVPKILISGLAISFLVLNTACSQPNVSAIDSDTRVLPAATSPSVSSPSREDVDAAPAGQVTELYDTIQPELGGMNNYSDVDPRQDTSEAARKAKQLSQNARRQQAQGANNPREAIDEVKKELDRKSIGERAQDFSNNVSSSAQKKTDELSKATQKGMKNISNNTRKFDDSAKSATGELTEKAEKRFQDSGDAVEKTAKNISKNTQQGVDKIQGFIDKSDNDT
jgi:hypothetical protein